MTLRAAALALLLPAAAAAGFRISLVEMPDERILTGVVTLAPAEVDSVLPLRFRVRATGTKPEKLERLALSGADFVTLSAPELPITIIPGAYVDLSAEYRPSLPGSSSATLQVNEDTRFLIAVAVAAPVLRLADGGPLRSGDRVDFGALELGQRAARRFVVENRGAEPLRISRLELVGAGGFSAVLPAVPLELAGGAAVEFEVVYEPRAEGHHATSVVLNSREYVLEGSATAPPVPAPRLAVDSAVLRSGRQYRVGIKLDSPARWPVSGVLRMEFTGAPDPAVRLLAGDGRALGFHVPAGADLALFGTATEAEFQTGTSAGRIRFTVELGPHNEQAVFDIAPEPVGFDTASARRQPAQLDVRFAAFDNTRTASTIAFRFFDAQGRQLGTGPLRVEAAADFRAHFDSSGLGGMFGVRAVFPVRGDAGLIASVEIEVVNSLGAARRSVTMTE